MAILHSAEISPSKLELADAWLNAQSWAPAGEGEMIGGYRFDDPAGEVGIEGLLVRRGETVLHVPLTYRGAPLEGAEESLVTTMTHTVLGDRWVYLAAGDPVAREVFFAALSGGATQAALEVHQADGTVEFREPPVQVVAHGEAGKATTADLQFLGRVEDQAPGHESAVLVATWPGGSGVVVSL